MIQQKQLWLFLILVLVSVCYAATGSNSLEDIDEEDGNAVKGQNQVLQNAFDEILRRRRDSERRRRHDQVVRLSLPQKSNKSIRGFSQAEKDYLLLVHNAYRSAVQPRAARMMEMVWDDGIAAMAQDWANQCTATHRPGRNLGRWRNMGENIYWSYSGRYHEGYAVKFWWDEIRWYNYTTRRCEPRRQCGHYVTMTWDRSDRMGCGVNRCGRLQALPDYNGRGAYYFVCNYNGRFYSHRRPYRAHRTPCSRCFRTSAPRCRYNLCVTQRMLDCNIGYNGSTAEIGFNRTITSSSRRNASACQTINNNRSVSSK